MQAKEDGFGILQTVREVFSNKNVLATSATSFLFMTCMMIYMPFWSLYLLELGASIEIVALITIVQNTSMLLFQLPGGVIADRFGRKVVILAAAVVRIITPIIYFFSQTWQHLLLGLIINSFTSIGSPGFQSLIAESLPLEKRATGYGIYRAFMMIPMIYSTTLGGVIMDTLGFKLGMRVAFVFYIISSVMGLIIRLKYISETLEEDKSKDVESVSLISSIHYLKGSLLVMLIASAISSFAMRMISPFTSIYITQIIGLSKTQLGILMSVGFTITVLLIIPGGVIADRFDRRLLIVFSRFMAPIINLGYIFIRDFYLLLLLQVVVNIGTAFGGGAMMWMGGPAWQSLIADLTEPSSRGRIMGFMATVTGIAALPSSYIGAYLWNIRPENTFFISITLGLVSTLILFKFVKDPRIRH